MFRNRLGALGAGRGLAYGLGLFVVQDELANWLLGTSGPPTAYPWQAHARSIVGHTALGVATDLTLDALDRVA